MKRSLGFCALAALLYVLMLNGGTVMALVEGRATPVQMGIQTEAADEAHYFAFMQTAARGHWLTGSASLREWRDSPGNPIFGPLLQAALLRAGLPLPLVIWAGDMVFPMLTMLLLCVILLRFFPTLESIAISVILMNTIGLGWLRSVNPQITMTLLTLYIAMVLYADRKNLSQQFLRGLLIAVLCVVQIQLAVYCCAAEAVWIIAAVIRRPKGWKEEIPGALVLGFPVMIAVVGQALLLMSADALALADTRRRLGLIDSRLPAAPQLHVLLLLAALGVGWMQRQRSNRTADIQRLGLLIIAGFLVLDQSVIHGKDAIFGLYYRSTIVFVSMLALWSAAKELMANHLMLRFTMFALAILSMASLMRQVQSGNEKQKVEAAAFVDSKVMDVIESLQKEPGGHVVLAPFEIGNIVPVYTPHTVAFNRYSRFGMDTDADLALRFILYRSLFPRGDSLIDDPSHSLVLGQYAGNSAARRRVSCLILAKIRGENIDCTVPIRSQIYHQELLPILDDTRSPDRVMLMEEFGVDRLVTKDVLPPELTKICSLIETIGPWHLYSCDPSVSTR